MKAIQVLVFGILLAVTVYIISSNQTPVFDDLPIGEQTFSGQELTNEASDVSMTSEDLNIDNFAPVDPPEANGPSDVENIGTSVLNIEGSGEERVPVVAPPVVSPVELAPKFDEAEIMSAVVRIRCGKSYGSGFSLERNGKRYVLTAAHVVIDQMEFFKKYQCDVIYPQKDANGNYQEAHYRIGTILLPDETILNYEEKGIDLAILEVIPLADKNEDLQKFPNGYPYLNYLFCPAGTLGDSINLWGFSANLGTAITPGAFMSKFQGEIVQYEDVVGVTKKASPEFLNGFVYLPKFEHSLDQNILHHLTVILSTNNFSGASGGLVFNTSKACIVGVNIATLV